MIYGILKLIGYGIAHALYKEIGPLATVFSAECAKHLCRGCYTLRTKIRASGEAWPYLDFVLSA